MAQALSSTDLKFPVWSEKYTGKVRDVYNIAEEVLVLVASDRISAFDHVLSRPIPFKGQVLNQTAAYFMEATRDVCPNHVLAVPDPNVTIGVKCTAFPVELVVRGYLAGHAWRTYKAGGRVLCGVTMPDGLRENDPFPTPIITPTTKSKIGHDEDISEIEITKSGLVDPSYWEQIRHYALALYKRGSEMAADKGLLLVDTKYEFGLTRQEQVILIDEVHTPDSSRYFFKEGYADRQSRGEAQPQLSKEFVREWLMERGFMGRDGDVMPTMDDAFVGTVTERYIGLYERVTGRSFERADTHHIEQRIQANVLASLEAMGLLK
jgi:phosphoribosylaminoimidazole-succinocarboxamide synthase